MPHVRLLSAKRISKAGVLTTYVEGDVVKVGKQTALEWILEGSAEDPFKQLGPPAIPKTGTPSMKFGIVIRNQKASLRSLGSLASRVKISYGMPELPYEHTLIWDGITYASESLIEYGFLRILKGAGDAAAWDIAANLFSTDKLALTLGTPEEREKTKEVVGSLRLPVYVSGLVWARKTDPSIKMIETWREELEQGADSDHAFLRALYQVGPMICTMPPANVL